LQPGDKQRTDSIVTLLTAHIRTHIATDVAVCEEPLALLRRISPDQALPPDLSEAIAKTKQAAETRGINLRRMQEQLARLTSQADIARSEKALAVVRSKLQGSGLLNAQEVEVQPAAKELLGKINTRLSNFETALAQNSPTMVPAQTLASRGGVAVGLLLAAIAAGLLFFLWPSHPSGVPVQISVRPDHATIELDGQTCVAPDCKFLLKPGEYIVSLRKAGYRDRTVAITVKPGDSTPLNLNAALEPLATPISDVSNRGSGTEMSTAALAKIEIRGALPRTRIRLDGEDMGVASSNGLFLLRVPPGPHTLDLSLDGFANRTIKRDFARGEIVSLADSAVQLEPQQPNIQR
jgi:hypothetical protein